MKFIVESVLISIVSGIVLWGIQSCSAPDAAINANGGATASGISGLL